MHSNWSFIWEWADLFLLWMHLKSVREALQQLNSFRRCKNDNGLAEVKRPKGANNDLSRVQFQRKRLLLHNNIQIISASNPLFPCRSMYYKLYNWSPGVLVPSTIILRYFTTPFLHFESFSQRNLHILRCIPAIPSYYSGIWCPKNRSDLNHFNISWCCL